jgi:hypothetical protein
LKLKGGDFATVRVSAIYLDFFCRKLRILQKQQVVQQEKITAKKSIRKEAKAFFALCMSAVSPF